VDKERKRKSKDQRRRITQNVFLSIFSPYGTTGKVVLNMDIIADPFNDKKIRIYI
jgi:repressor of nif and glnA expression